MKLALKLIVMDLIGKEGLLGLVAEGTTPDKQGLYTLEEAVTWCNENSECGGFVSCCHIYSLIVITLSKKCSHCLLL